MIIYRDWIKIKRIPGGKVIRYYYGYFLLGFIPLYIHRTVP